MARAHIRWLRSLRGDVRAKLLGKHGLGVVAETKNGRLLLDPRDFSVSNKLLRDGQYDWTQVQALSALLDGNDDLLVVGAHIGSLLVPLAQRAGRSFAFEANPATFIYLQANVLLNRLEHTLIENLAISDRAQRIEIVHNRINSGASHIRNSADGGVMARTLDDYFSNYQGRIGLMVMDIEGSEVAALRGAANVMSRVQRLYTEISAPQLERQGSSVAEMLALLSQHFNTAQIFRDDKFHSIALTEAEIIRDAKDHGRVHNVLLSRA